MNLFTLILIGVGLSIDSLAASITIGACAARIRKIEVLKIALFMTVFQAILPLVGWLIGNSFKNIVEDYDHWVAFVMLFFIGAKMIYEGWTKKEEEVSKLCPSNNLMLAGMALATSIDALAVGISFGLMEINIGLAILIIGIATFIFSSTGVVLGKRIGDRVNKGIDIFGGLVLIGLGTKILISHTCL